VLPMEIEVTAVVLDPELAVPRTGDVDAVPVK
jgi:hypothetical protein